MIPPTTPETLQLIKGSIKAVIFDHDGTLVDSEPVHLKMWQSVISPHHLHAEEYSQHLSGKPTAQSSSWVKQTFKLEQSPEDLEREKKQRLKEYLKTGAFPLMQGALELLEQLLQRKIPMAVASGATTHEVTHSINFHKLEKYFLGVSTGDMVDNNKPAPDVYLHAAESLNIDPRHCLAIEDSDSGQQSALRAGMTCLRLNTPSQYSSTPPNSQLISSLLHAQELINQII